MITLTVAAFGNIPSASISSKHATAARMSCAIAYACIKLLPPPITYYKRHPFEVAYNLVSSRLGTVSDNENSMAIERTEEQIKLTWCRHGHWHQSLQRTYFQMQPSRYACPHASHSS